MLMHIYQSITKAHYDGDKINGYKNSEQQLLQDDIYQEHPKELEACTCIYHNKRSAFLTTC